MGKIGDMDRRIELKSVTSTKGAMGGVTRSYTHLCYCMAERVSAGTSPEQYVANRLVVSPRYKYRIHARSGVAEDMQIVDGTSKYNILAVDYPDDLFIEMLAQKIVE